MTLTVSYMTNTILNITKLHKDFKFPKAMPIFTLCLLVSSIDSLTLSSIRKKFLKEMILKKNQQTTKRMKNYSTCKHINPLNVKP